MVVDMMNQIVGQRLTVVRARAGKGTEVPADGEAAVDAGAPRNVEVGVEVEVGNDLVSLKGLKMLVVVGLYGLPIEDKKEKTSLATLPLPM